MKLKDLLLLILEVAEKNNLSRPWIVGGLPRDKVLGRQNEFNDLDLSTGDIDVRSLGPLLLKHLSSFKPHYEVLSDGHGKMKLGKLQIDFSNHFLTPKIENILKFKNIVSSPMNQELYSRDFFCNTLLLNLELNQIYDPSGEGLKDIKAKQIRTCLPPEITFVSDPKRLVRAVYLAAKLNFKIENQTKKFMQQHPELLQQISPSYLIKKITKALELNSTIASQLLTELNYWRLLPATEELAPYIQKNLI